MADLGYDRSRTEGYVIERYGGMTDRLSASIGYACDRLIPNLRRMTDEVDNLLDGFNGEYVLPGPSGAPTRGGADILPMGRNYYGVDPS
ncbi:MAG: cobaltochelatase subunit CobN, partial [Candidatus Methanoplasma sp.]|nr:cobaltochelatase subunit CobN [Candidatus Methanoplasma sp.]